MEFRSLAGFEVSSLNIPDDVTIPQFLFDTPHRFRPNFTETIPWLIEDVTSRRFYESDVRNRVHGLANGLHIRYGVGENDVVLLFSRNHIDYPIAIWATHYLHGIISGANPEFMINELVYQIQETKAKVLLVHPDAYAVGLAAAQEAGLPSERVILFDVPGHITENMYSSHDTIGRLIEIGLRQKLQYVARKLKTGEARTKIALYSFSSGTTGRPKAVAIPHYAVIANVLQLAVHNRVYDDSLALEEKRYRPGDIAIGVLPLYHIYGLVVNLHFLLFSKVSLVIVATFRFEDMLKTIVQHRINHLLLVPPQVILLCKHPAVKRYDLRSCIRSIMCGAAPLSTEVNQKIFELLPDAHIGQAYGMTETSTVTTMWPITRKRGVSGSSGILLPGITAKVLKQDGTLAKQNEAGELVIKTPSVALCYSNSSEATKETFINGWVRTGDEVMFREDGEMFVVDRLKEFLKVKGFQVAPAEIEGCLLDHPYVDNTCVVGVPDDYTGEAPFAFVVLTKEASNRASAGESTIIKRSIISHVAKNKIHYKHLTGGVEFVSVIPISPSGKLLRRVLRDHAKNLRKTMAKL